MDIHNVTYIVMTPKPKQQTGLYGDTCLLFCSFYFITTFSFATMARLAYTGFYSLCILDCIMAASRGT